MRTCFSIRLPRTRQNDAPLLILDEPTNTLDVPSAHELRAVVRDLKRNKAGRASAKDDVCPVGSALKVHFGTAEDNEQVGLRKSETLRSLWSRRGRTVLTIVGISIGLTAVVALSGISEGFIREMGELFNQADIDLVARQAGSSDLGYSAISERVGRQIATIPGVESVSGLVVGFVTMEQMPFVMVMGYDPQEPAIRHFKIVRGRGLSGSREAILGRPAADLLKGRMVTCHPHVRIEIDRCGGVYSPKPAIRDGKVFVSGDFDGAGPIAPGARAQKA